MNTLKEQTICIDPLMGRWFWWYAGTDNVPMHGPFADFDEALADVVEQIGPVSIDSDERKRDERTVVLNGGEVTVRSKHFGAEK